MPLRSPRIPAPVPVLVVTVLLGCPGPPRAAGPDHPPLEEAVQRAEEAARLLAGTGEAGLAEFRGEGSAHVWQDVYVFVLDCAKGTTVAHPVTPEWEGEPIAAGPAYGGVTAAQRGAAQCAAARDPDGGWLEYPFPRPGEERPSRQITYLLPVPGTPYAVGAGVYAAEEEEAAGARR
jgi:cytochrome c